MSKLIRVNVSNGVQVAGHHFKVKTGGHINDRLKEGRYYGRCYHTEKEILIDNSSPEELVSNNFLHEVIHAVSDAFCGDSLSERETKGLANGLHQVLEDLGIRFVTSSTRNKDSSK